MSNYIKKSLLSVAYKWLSVLLPRNRGVVYHYVIMFFYDSLLTNTSICISHISHESVKVIQQCANVKVIMDLLSLHNEALCEAFVSRK